MYRSRSIKALGVFVGFLGLFYTKACVGESFALFMLYLFLCALILLLQLEIPLFVYINLSSSNLLLAVQMSVP
jgi:hypothetical protein